MYQIRFMLTSIYLTPPSEQEIKKTVPYKVPLPVAAASVASTETASVAPAEAASTKSAAEAASAKSAKASRTEPTGGC
jgi:hypothetical protein